VYRLISFAAAVIGLALAFVIQRIFGQVRRRALLPAVVVGWAVALILVVAIVVLIEGCQIYPMDYDPTRPYWLKIALGIGVFLVICGLIAQLHCDRLKISWRDAYGEMMAEAGIDAAIAWAVGSAIFGAYNNAANSLPNNATLSQTPEFLRIVSTPAHAGNLTLAFACALGVGWLVLEGLVPFLLVPRRRPVPAVEPAAEPGEE
jgi:hypothetical protein